MAKFSAIVVGDVKLTAMLNSLGSLKARELHRRACRIAAQIVLDEATKSAPVRTGALRQSLAIRALTRRRGAIGVRITTREGIFKGETFYGGFIEFGWRAGKRLSGYRRKSAKVQDTRKKIPGRWFMRRAGVRKEAAVIDRYSDELSKMIKEA